MPNNRTRLPLPEPAMRLHGKRGKQITPESMDWYTADQMHAYSDAENAALRAELEEWRFTNRIDELDRHVTRLSEQVRVLREELRGTARELHACQSVIHLAGGFDPAYVSDAQVALKSARAALEAK